MDKPLLRPLAARFAAALAATAAPAPLLAQSAMLPAASYALSVSRTDAILGGAPSALTAILAQQGGRPVPQARVTSAAYTPAVLRPAPYFRQARPEPARTIASDRPDVFGSVALAIPRTPLDGRWQRVERARIGGTAGAFAASLRGAAPTARIDAVNRYVNRRVSFVDDSRQWGTADRWSAALDTLRRGRGDCEDYAIAKLQMLRAAGFSDRDLYLVIARDLVRQQDHAVLVVRASGRLLLLDNGTDRIGDASLAQDYRPVFTYAAGKRWTHGYRRQAPAFSIASADRASGAAIVRTGLPAPAAALK